MVTTPDDQTNENALSREGDAEPTSSPPSTGDPRVDRIVAPLADLDGQPPDQHVDAYDAAHSRLQETLADLDRDA